VTVLPVFANPQVALTVRGVTVLLTSNLELRMATTLTLGVNTATLTLGFYDQNGAPMSPTPTPDSAPAWTNSTPATETIAVSTDGLTCTVTPVAAGDDTVSVTVVVAGKSYSATLGVSVVAAVAPPPPPPSGQVLTSVGIIATVNTLAPPAAA